MYRQAVIYPAQVLERTRNVWLLANRYLGQTHWQLSTEADVQVLEPLFPPKAKVLLMQGMALVPVTTAQQRRSPYPLLPLWQSKPSLCPLPSVLPQQRLVVGQRLMLNNQAAVVCQTTERQALLRVNQQLVLLNVTPQGGWQDAATGMIASLH